MEREYIATFYNHFGAVRFHRERLREGRVARMQPVPRDLSSSCGTAVRFTADYPEEPELLEISDPHGEIEQLVELCREGYRLRYRSSE